MKFFRSMVWITCMLTLTTGLASAAKSVDLNGAGSTFFTPIGSRWFYNYNKLHPEVRVNYQSIGSGGGIQQVKMGTVDFGASDAPLSDQELKDMPTPITQIPVTAGAVVVAYNLPGVRSRVRLGGDTLADIFLGKIVWWDNPRITSLNTGVSLPHIPIGVVHRADGSGTTYIFTTYLSAVSNTWKNTVGSGKSVKWQVGLGGKGNEGVASGVKQTPGAIGYIELAYAVSNNLSYALVRNRENRFILPCVATTRAAVTASENSLTKDIRNPIVNAGGSSSYPIVGFTYLLLYKNHPNPEKGKALRELVRWCLTQGQSVAAGLQYAPLSPKLAKIDMRKVAERTGP